MEIPKCECKDCPDRCPEPNCHITCESYLKFRAYKEEQRQKVSQYKSVHFGNTYRSKSKAKSSWE